MKCQEPASLPDASSRHTYQSRVQNQVSVQRKVGGRNHGGVEGALFELVALVRVVPIEAVLSDEVNCCGSVSQGRWARWRRTGDLLEGPEATFASGGPLPGTVGA